MKQQLRLASVTVGLLTSLASPLSMAQTESTVTTTSNSSNTTQQEAMVALVAKTDALEKELVALQQQIAQLKQAQKASAMSS